MMDGTGLEIGQFTPVDMESDGLYGFIHSSDAIDVVEIVVDIDVEGHVIIKE